jgi:hypothetical protein
MKKNGMRPIPPGEILNEEFLKQRVHNQLLIDPLAHRPAHHFSRSMGTARYSHPAAVAMNVMSPTQARFDDPTPNC